MAAVLRSFWAALMCFHAARLPGRIDEAGDLNPLLVQDRSRWDWDLIAEGQALMDLSAKGTELSPYHVEAGHTGAHGQAALAPLHEGRAARHRVAHAAAHV